MEVCLFSTPAPGSSYTSVVDACREILKGRTDVNIVCLPQAMLTSEQWLHEAKRQFRNVAPIEVVNTETMESTEMEAALRRAALVHIPDGNAYLLNHRLQTSHIAAHMSRKILNGLPVVACGAGAVVCGPNILTTTDLNMVPTMHFNGLGVTPFNIHAGYMDNAEHDNWLGEYHSFHDNPVILLEDGASIRISGKTTSLRTSAGWILRPGQEKRALKLGEPISLT